MSATNKTLNYELPIFIDTDKPSWLGDWNGTMTKIDNSIKTVDGVAESGVTTANEALTTAEGAVTTAGNALTASGEAKDSATNAISVANNASLLAGGAVDNANEAKAVSEATNRALNDYIKSMKFTTLTGAPVTGSKYPTEVIINEIFCHIKSILSSSNIKTMEKETIVLGEYTYYYISFNTFTGNIFNLPIHTPNTSAGIIHIGYSYGIIPTTDGSNFPGYTAIRASFNGSLTSLGLWIEQNEFNSIKDRVSCTSDDFFLLPAKGRLIG